MRDAIVSALCLPYGYFLFEGSFIMKLTIKLIIAIPMSEPVSIASPKIERLEVK